MKGRRGIKRPDLITDMIVSDYTSGKFLMSELADKYSVSSAAIRYRLRQAGVYKRPERAPDQHGTRWTYRRGCHCEPCTDAATAYNRAHRNRYYGQAGPHGPGCHCAGCSGARKTLTIEDLGVDPSAKHGTFDSYFMGCECAMCTLAYEHRLKQQKEGS